MIGSTTRGRGALLVRSSRGQPCKTWLLRKNESLAASATFHEQFAIQDGRVPQRAHSRALLPPPLQPSRLIPSLSRRRHVRYPVLGLLFALFTLILERRVLFCSKAEHDERGRILKVLFRSRAGWLRAKEINANENPRLNTGHGLLRICKRHQLVRASNDQGTRIHISRVSAFMRTHLSSPL